jgi:hypothetical protein
MGNGAVFQLVPQRFRKEIGVMTGLVGMAGGVGGFYLASSLGYAKQITGSYQIGFLILAGLALLALAGLSGRQDSLADHLGCGAPDGSQDLIRSHGRGRQGTVRPAALPFRSRARMPLRVDVGLFVADRSA